MNWLLIGAAFVAWTALLALLYRLTIGVSGVVKGVGKVVEQVRSPDLEQLGSRLGQLEAKVEGLPSVWEDHEHRVRKWSERARFYERKSAERDAESDQGGDDSVRELDGSGSSSNGMQQLPSGVERPAAPPEDYIAAGWRRKLGMS